MKAEEIALIQTAIKGLAATQMALRTLMGLDKNAVKSRLLVGDGGTQAEFLAIQEKCTGCEHLVTCGSYRCFVDACIKPEPEAVTPDYEGVQASADKAQDPHFGHAESQIHRQGRDLPKVTPQQPVADDDPGAHTKVMQEFLEKNKSISILTPIPTEAVSMEALKQGFLRRKGSELAGKTAETIVNEFADFISKPVLDGRNE